MDFFMTVVAERMKPDSALRCRPNGLRPVGRLDCNASPGPRTHLLAQRHGWAVVARRSAKLKLTPLRRCCVLAGFASI